MNRRSFLGRLAAVLVAPLVGAFNVRPPWRFLTFDFECHLSGHQLRLFRKAQSDYQARLVAELERDFWGPPVPTACIPWIVPSGPEVLG